MLEVELRPHLEAELPAGAVAAICNAVPDGTWNGWVVAWESPVEVPVRLVDFVSTVVQKKGWNAVFVYPTERQVLLDVVIDAADWVTVAYVVDLESL